MQNTNNDYKNHLPYVNENWFLILTNTTDENYVFSFWQQCLLVLLMLLFFSLLWSIGALMTGTGKVCYMLHTTMV